MKYYLGKFQGVPADRFDMTEFVCDSCRATRDSVCAECSDWPKAVARSAAGTKLIDAARSLGKVSASRLYARRFCAELESLDSPVCNLVCIVRSSLTAR